MVHADFKKDWRLVDRAPNNQAYDRVQKLFLGLDQLAITENDFLVFRFSPEAQEHFYSWLTKLEIFIRAEENDCDAFLSHISKYRKLVPALAMQFFLLKKIENTNRSGGIDKECIENAIEWARHLELHARRVYALALNPQIHAARSLALKIKQGKVRDGMRVRDIYRHQWSHLKTRSNVDTAVAVLIECSWVIIEEIRPITGAPYEVLKINPKLLKANEEPKESLDRTDRTLAGTSVSSVKRVFEVGA